MQASADHIMTTDDVNPFETAEEDVEAPATVPVLVGQGQGRRRASPPSLFLDSLEVQPAPGAKGKGKGRAKGRRRIGKIFQHLNFRRRKGSASDAATTESGSPTGRSLLAHHADDEEDGEGAEDVPEFRDPFGDEHAMEWTLTGSSTSPARGRDERRRSSASDASLAQWALATRTPERRAGSTPSTPSRWSRRSSVRTHTPGSGRSWLSDLSGQTEVSATSSMRRKRGRRKERERERARRMVSQMKSIRLLGAEAAGAVAAATNVSVDRLQMSLFGQSVDEHLKKTG
ncbi:hypothetical protein C8Q76DRAFT_750395 [Earliella scabrosa]|nr:hypothetical protein C8Q76DRAFT_750395 [Earliella scabrosa]